MIYPRTAEVEGTTAAFLDLTIDDNPYPEGSEIADSWDYGYVQGFRIEAASINKLLPEI
jgi:hypothetical protein